VFHDADAFRMMELIYGWIRLDPMGAAS